jgi:carbon monoxide dehydrogenase subunit G
VPTVERSATMSASRERVWEFVRDMDNWAAYLRGYEGHRKIDENQSIWLLKGNLGGLTRIAEFRVIVTEWAGPDRVTFQLEGLNEPMSGSGSFRSVSIAPNAEVDETSGLLAPVHAEAGPGFIARFWQGFWRSLLHMVLPGPKTSVPAASEAAMSTQSALPVQTQVTFELSLSVAGTTGKIVDLLIAPMLAPVAEELIEKIATALNASVTPEAVDTCS